MKVFKFDHMEFEEVFRVIDTAVVAKTQRHLKDVEKFVLWGAYCGKTYTQIANASEYRYTPSYLQQDIGPKLWKLLSATLGERLSKKNFRAALLRQSHSATIPPPKPDNPNKHTDWGEAIDVSIFYGRTNELATLQQWIINQRCRLVAILGIGGIGKTALAVHTAQQIQPEFDYLIWRSLRNALPVEHLLTELILILSHHQETDLTQTIDAKISHLICYLRASRCLLILDNFEAILSSGSRYYREGYQGYGELIKRIGEVAHQSCLILTSREKPAEFAVVGETLPVRTLQLTGLNELAAQQLLKAQGLACNSETSKLVELYKGNPLALKIVSTAIHALFAGNTAKFLAQEIIVFNEIRNLLDQQFNRLSNLETQIMYWLAINREPVCIKELQADIFPPICKSKLLEAIESLKWRGLIEINETGCTQQTVVMNYMTEKLVERVYAENAENKLNLLISYALINSTAKDYVKANQIYIIFLSVMPTESYALCSLCDHADAQRLVIY